VFLGGRDEGGLDALEDDLLVDVLLAVDRVDNSQQFAWVHRNSLSLSGRDLTALFNHGTPRRSRAWRPDLIERPEPGHEIMPPTLTPGLKKKGTEVALGYIVAAFLAGSATA
jgi:hypothetical protein